MTFYRRNLPHWQPEGAVIFLTWRLHGSLPYGTVSPDCARRGKERGHTEMSGCAGLETPGERFRRLDMELDRLGNGPRWLADPRVAECVERVIIRGQNGLGQYQLYAYAVMPNHVHLLIEPLVSVTRIMRGIKGVSAREANRILHRTGELFWQDESYDHWVRSEGEFWKIVGYIENNPVCAKLVEKPEDWKWSSAGDAGICRFKAAVEIRMS
jgi:REP-associated tyrosine transposase